MDIRIRDMRPGDADDLFRLLSDPKVMRYLEPPYDRARAEAFLCSAGLADPPLVYAVEENGTFLGYVIDHAYDENSVEIGWVLFPEYWGHGYASALTDLLIGRARQAQKDVVIECDPAQEATKRIARKKGFSACGIRDGLAVYRLFCQMPLSRTELDKGQMDMDDTPRFDGKSEIYAKARPRYAAGLFDHLENALHIPAGSVFADVDAGTGILTEQLLERGYRVFAVEPNADMRRKAEEKLSGRAGFFSVDGDAGDTGLPDGSVDCVTAAQAFHWFDAAAFRAECRRVLKPGGRVVIIYNHRVDSAVCTEMTVALYRRYDPAFPGFSNGISREKCVAFFAGGCDTYRADNTQIYDRQGFIDRVLSSSYSVKESDARYADYLKDIGEIFDRCAADGRIAVPTETVAFSGTV